LYQSSNKQIDVNSVPLYSLNLVEIDAGSMFQQPKHLPQGLFLSVQQPITYLLSICRLLSHRCDQQCSHLRRVLISSRVALVVLVRGS
jgi:hypothetical protein